MTYFELKALTSDSCAINTAASSVKDLLTTTSLYASGESFPYVIEHRLYGDVYIFSEYFIELILKAFDTDCMLAFSSVDLNIFENYLSWIDTDDTGGNPLALYTSLDAVLRALVTCATVPRPGDCTPEYITEYIKCAT